LKAVSKVFIVLLFSMGVAHAANVKVITKYSKTGGIKGELNEIGDKVNGRDICPVDPTAGCDFSDDPGWSDNGTPNDGSDDTYSGDLIVRTNDIFEIVAAWSWNGEVGTGEDTITLKSTLPDGYAWEDLPGACDSSLSSIDGQDMVCVRKDVDKNNVGTVAEDLPFSVRVLGEVANGTQPGDIAFEISAKNATTQSDNAGVSLTVTASPRWNLQKSFYGYSTGVEYNGTTGYKVSYKYYIEVDEVDGEIDNAPGFLGVESMGSDATFSFTDDLSQVSPNAQLMDCIADEKSNSKDPYAYYNSNYPDKSIATPQGTQTIECTQSGSTISIQLQHVDATLNHIPVKARNGSDIPVNRAIAAIGVIEVFVPIQDVKNGKDGVEGTSDDGSLPTKNVLKDFDPTAPSGNSNFGSDTESELDNSYEITLYAAKGGFSKAYAVKHGLWKYTEGDSAGWRTGDGLLTKDAEFATILRYYNRGGVDLTGGIICDVIDANRMTIEEIPADEARYEGLGGFDIYLKGGFDPDDLEFEYASTYVDDSWLASKGGDLNVAHGNEVVNECSATTGWYSTMDEAKENGLGVITKVRIKVKDGKALSPGQNIYVWLKHKVREKTIDGTPLQNGDELVNYVSVIDNEYYEDWYKPGYIPHDYPTAPENGGGDRVTYTSGKVRIIKSVDKTTVEPGSIVTFSLDSSFTNDTGSSETDNVVIKDLLPKGLKYISGSTKNAAEPTIGSCADISELTVSCSSDNQVLIWDLGDKTTNVEIADINYSAQVEITAPQGVMTNYAVISSPSDISEVSQRESDININVTIPATINLSKSVTYTTPQEVNGDPIGYEINARNGSSGTVNNLDIIDILPFNGDGDDGAIKFRDLSLKRTPGSSFHGSRTFASMELREHPDSAAQCDLSSGIKYYYTKEPSKNVNMSPKDTSNELNTVDSIWCEGDENGPYARCGFSNAEVTAIRALGASMEKDAVCQLHFSMEVLQNQIDDFYNNSSGASGDEVTLPVLSNSATTVIVGSGVGDFVWFDANDNGIQDIGESGLNDINVSLYKADGTFVATTRTVNDANGKSGYYYFDNLHSGDYYIQITPPQNFKITSKDEGGDDTKDSDFDTNGKTSVFTLGVDTTDRSWDAGLYKTSSIGDTIWYDSNKNGIQDDGEDCGGIELNVSLLSNGTKVAKTMTQNCHYQFDNLNQGTYQIKVNLPNGYEFTQKGDGSNSAKDSDIDVNTMLSDDIVLANGIDITDIDIGFFTNTSLGDLVWLDKNANGVQDAGEEGVDGITVELFKEDGTKVATTTTANGGKYSFKDLLPGNYKVKFTLPSGYLVSAKDAVMDDAKDSDVYPDTLTTDMIAINGGSQNTTVDLGIYKEVSIGDTIWVDNNENGLQDSGEDCDNLNIQVTLVEQNISTTTQNCTYSFEHLKPGSYTLKFDIPQGYSAAQKDMGDDTKDSDIDNDGKTVTVTLSSGEVNKDIDGGFLKDASLGDKIWLDSNANGIQDANEKGIKDVNITLLYEDGTSTGKMTTSDENGMYKFEGLKPAKYKIKVSLPDGYKVTGQNSTDDAADSDIDPFQFISDAVTLHSGENYVNLDGGVYESTSIGDFIWLDANTNGVQDAGEKGIADIEVILLDKDKNPTGKTTKTNKDGYYSFDDLIPGSYAVKIKLPDGYVVSPKEADADKKKDSNIDPVTLESDLVTVQSGKNDYSIDVGIYAFAQLGDRVWLDADADGIQDDNEKGVADVTVNLLNEDGSIYKTTKTDSNGIYHFTGLKPVDYKVSVELPQGYVFSPANRGDDDNFDSDIVTENNMTDTISMQSGENDNSVDIGLVALKNISGDVRVDIDSDKNGDRGLKDVQVKLQRCDDLEVVQTTHTDKNGNYNFAGVIPGCYIITEMDPPGYKSVTDIDGVNDNNITVSLLDKDITGQGFVDEPLLKISGHVRADMDFDGDIEVDNSEDINLADVEVVLYKDGKEVQRIKTDKNGFYEFGDLTPGDYTIKEKDPKGFDSLRDVDGKNDNTIAVTLVDHDITEQNFDDQKTVLIAGTIRVDIDGDKIADEPLKNSQLLLCLEGTECTPETSLATTYTDDNGSYVFDGLKPGDYVIVEVDKPGYESLKDVYGENDNIIKVRLDGFEDVYDQDFEDLAIAPHFVVIQKSVAKKEVHIGSFVSYAIEVENVDNAFKYAALKIKDILPGGFKYEKGSARLIRGKSKQKLDAKGISVVEFGPFVLNPKEKVTITYLLKVGVGAAQGKHVNKAVAVSNDEEVSNLSKATVKVVSDPFIDNAVVVGKIFLDHNANGVQDKGEEGIPGVRLATVTGLVIETDGYGRYHVPDVDSGGFGGRGKNFIIKVDPATLPKGATFTTENPRVYRVTSGALNTIDFGVKVPQQKRLQRTRKIKKVVVEKKLVEVPKEIKIGSIYFDSDQDCIRPDQVEKLKEIAEKLKQYGHGAIKIEGNTDARAPMWYNKKLAYKRAQSVFIELRHLLGDALMEDVEVVYHNCQKEVKFNPLYDWWGKPNAPKTKKECTKFGILQKDCNRLLSKGQGGVK